MDQSQPSIHIFFFPFLARGHTIPLLDIARLFACRSGVRCTFVTTPGNSSYILATVEQAKQSGLPLDLHLIPFPAAEVGLPPGAECTDSLPPGADALYKLYTGVGLLRHPLERLLIERRPDCIVSDSILSWPADLASSLSIPHFKFSIAPPFATAVAENIFLTDACTSSSSVGPLVGLPHPLELTRAELPPVFDYPVVFHQMREAEKKSCGIMFNSFDELEGDYVGHCRKVTLSGSPKKVWCIGPAQLYKSLSQAEDDWDGMMVKKWLDSKQPESVIYISFGTECFFSAEQLREIAVGLQSCGHPFVWVVRGMGGGVEAATVDEWLPEEFREAVGDRGVVVTEWAPQVAILNHRATGGFMTHCGWNSTIEAVSAGLPVIAWPLQSEQFLNERFLVEVVRMAVRILDGPGMRSVEAEGKGLVKGEVIRDAVDRLMGGIDEEARAMRATAKRYKELARSAMEEGGSSYVNLTSMIEHMKMLVEEKKK